LALSGMLVIAAGIAAGAIYGVSKLSASPVSAQEQQPKPEKVVLLSIEEIKNGERFGGDVRITFVDPPELPEQGADAAGLFLSRDGNVLTVGTGLIEVDVSVEALNDQEPVTTINASHDGDDVPVTVDENTVYYKDVTERPEITPEMIAAGEHQVTLELEPGSLDEIGDNMEIRAWGEVADGQLVADVLVYGVIK
jgi:hypothetical protein